MRVMHIKQGRPLISAEHEPHLPALQFQRTARSPAWVACRSVDDVEHDLALIDLDVVVLELAAAGISAPDAELAGVPHHLPPSKKAWSSGGIVGRSCRNSLIWPSVSSRIKFTLPHSASVFGIVVARVPAAALGALQRGLGNALRDAEHVVQVDREVPTGVVLAVPLNGEPARALAQLADCLEGPLHLLRVPDDADELVHRLLQLVLDRVRVLATFGLEWRQRRLLRGRDVLRSRSGTGRQLARVLGGVLPRSLAEHEQVPRASCHRAGSSRACHRPPHRPRKDLARATSAVSGSTSTPPIT